MTFEVEPQEGKQPLVSARIAHDVSVNGGASMALSYAKTNWDKRTVTTLHVKLNAGANTSRFSRTLCLYPG